MRTLAHASTEPSEALLQARDIGKALSDIGRLRILAALGDRELCVCHMVGLLQVDPSTVSRHVGILRRAGLISVRKDGRWLWCRRDATRTQLWKTVDELLALAPEVAQDREALDRETLC